MVRDGPRVRGRREVGMRCRHLPFGLLDHLEPLHRIVDRHHRFHHPARTRHGGPLCRCGVDERGGEHLRRGGAAVETRIALRGARHLHARDRGLRRHPAERCGHRRGGACTAVLAVVAMDVDRPGQVAHRAHQLQLACIVEAVVADREVHVAQAEARGARDVRHRAVHRDHRSHSPRLERGEPGIAFGHAARPAARSEGHHVVEPGRIARRLRLRRRRQRGVRLGGLRPRVRGGHQGQRCNDGCTDPELDVHAHKYRSVRTQAWIFP